jgi:hypothetical protein
MVRSYGLCLLLILCTSVASAQFCENGVCYPAAAQPTSVLSEPITYSTVQSEVVEYSSPVVTQGSRRPLRNIFSRLRARVRSVRQMVLPRLAPTTCAIPSVTFQNVCESEIQCSDVQTIVFSSSSRPLERVAAKRALRVQGRMTAMKNFAATGVNTRMLNLLSSVFPRAWFNLR